MIECLFFFLISVGFGIPITIYAYKKGFYQYESKLPTRISFWQLVTAFGLFLLIQVVGSYVALTFFDAWMENALQGLVVPTLVASSITLFFLLAFSLLPSLRKMWVASNYSITTGVFAWIAVLPLVFFVQSLLCFFLQHFLGIEPIEQEPIKLLRVVQSDPQLFSFLAIFMVTVIPVIEEILFRGFLLNYVRKFCSPMVAVGIVSFLFTMAHFSSDQGLSNLEILPPLFLLAFFLGFVYLKTGSLLSSITLHSLFNFGSLILFLADSYIA